MFPAFASLNRLRRTDNAPLCPALVHDVANFHLAPALDCPRAHAEKRGDLVRALHPTELFSSAMSILASGRATHPFPFEQAQFDAPIREREA
jgi:hypothetical protein